MFPLSCPGTFVVNHARMTVNLSPIVLPSRTREVRPNDSGAPSRGVEVRNVGALYTGVMMPP